MIRKDWQPLLCFGAANGYEDLVQLALSQGAEIEARNAYGFTPLLLAAANGHTATLRHLLLAGADRQAVTLEGQTALMLAAEQGHAEVLKLLFAYGADRKPARTTPTAEERLPAQAATET